MRKTYITLKLTGNDHGDWLRRRVNGRLGVLVLVPAKSGEAELLRRLGVAIVNGIELVLLAAIFIHKSLKWGARKVRWNWSYLEMRRQLGPQFIPFSRSDFSTAV